MEIKRNEAVSPVVGVMLMLVVTIIIAAVVSAFAGGMASGQEKAPAASIDCNIKIDGTWGGSGFDIVVLACDEPIPTKNLKLVTSWKASDGTVGGAEITGPTVPHTAHYNDNASTYSVPLGFGPGIEDWRASGSYSPNQHYGNYTLVAGTRMHNSPYGWSAEFGGYGVSSTTRYTYTDGEKFVKSRDRDAMMVILGDEWDKLRSGDVVSVKLVHIPTGSVIFSDKVVVEG
ncbi:MAG: type IV pilin N-terminal domain-containing protein [Methanogenium sp.]|jgi:FlaG/FlaF family flagellin (archaellin)